MSALEAGRGLERRAATRAAGRRDRAFAIAVSLAAALVTAVFLLILGHLVVAGASALSVDYLLSAPRDAGRAGGVAPMLVSTLALLAVCLSVSLPLGVGTAALLSELTARGGRFAVLVRRSLDVSAGVPSIVFGLFGNAFFCQALGLGYSILAGGLTLACMVLPILIRSTEVGMRAVAQEHRHAAAALGLSRATTVFRLVLPASAPALVVGLVLGLGRAAAETAALLFTSGYVARTPGSLLDSGRALSVHVYDLSMNVAGGSERAHAAALVLIAVLVVSNGGVTWLAERGLAGRAR